MHTDPHSRNLRKHRRMQGGGLFYVTKCLCPRRPLLAERQSGLGQAGADAIVEALLHLSASGRLRLAAFVAMPDHWHAVFGTERDDALPKVMHSLGSWIGRKTRALCEAAGVAWQDGYYETRIRSGRQFTFVCHYIEDNPVREKLVEQPSEWLWSSANVAYLDCVIRPWPGPFEIDDHREGSLW